jgi:hypothetical protein
LKLVSGASLKAHTIIVNCSPNTKAFLPGKFITSPSANVNPVVAVSKAGSLLSDVVLE